MVPELVIELLMWRRRRRRVISPQILAAAGATRDIGEEKHGNERSNRLRHRHILYPAIC